MAASHSQEKVKRALESAESLLASFLDRASLGPAAGAEKDLIINSHNVREDRYVSTSRDSVDVEQSLLGLGEGNISSTSSAHEAVSYPSDIPTTPKDTLTSLVGRSFVSESQQGSLDPHFLQEQLYQVEKDLNLSAKIGLALSKRVDFLEKEVGRLTGELEIAESTLKQTRHELGRKDSLLKLYYVHEEQEEPEVDQSPPDRVRLLSEENEELKSINKNLLEDNQHLKNEAQTTLEKERALVQQLFDQLSQVKEEFQTEMEHQEEICHQLQTKLDNSCHDNDLLRQSKETLTEELEDMRERMTEAQFTLSQLSMEILEWQDRYDSVHTLMKDAQEENKMLRELTSANRETNSAPTESEHHESIVQEIEEVLRREIIAASTLPERPPSPNNYAQQRTMVVMETVKAATLATARKLEKLAAEQRKKEEDLQQREVGLQDSLPSDGQDDPTRMRYFSPQKLQIVKPMEGSVTLLRWKLLATPQLRGPGSFLSETEQPGIHLKNFSESRPGSSLQVDSIDSQRRWHSVCDLSRPVKKDTPIRIHQRYDEETQGQMSTVGRVKQNLWGLFSPSGRGKKSQEKPQDHKGLQELLGP